MRTLRLLVTSTLSVISVFTLSIRSGCLSITDHAPESPLHLSPRVPAPRWLYWVSPRQLLQSDTGVPHFALDPLTYRCLLSLSPAAGFAEPRPPRHRCTVRPFQFVVLLFLPAIFVLSFHLFLNQISLCNEILILVTVLLESEPQ